jgi:hypothetical protein
MLLGFERNNQTISLFRILSKAIFIITNIYLIWTLFCMKWENNIKYY